MRGDSLLRMPLRHFLFPGVARLLPRSHGSREPGISFYPHCHAFCRSGMREYKPHPMVCNCSSECSGTHSHACHSSAPYFPELRAYSRGPLGLVNLGLHFGPVVMRFVEVAWVSTSLFPLCALNSESVVGLTLTHPTPTPIICWSCASIPEVHCV